MDLAVMPPVSPMLARAVKTVPRPDADPAGMAYEPKWDGFRCLVFVDGDEVELGSRGERPLTRYFPEVVEAVRRELPPRCVIDGEIVVPAGDTLDFEALQQRIHPAASRVRLLAEQTPASLICFDVLARGGESAMERGFGERRALLEELLAGAGPPVHLTPLTDSYERALGWFEEFEGAGLDGVIAKARGEPYRPGQRAMIKVKHDRTADCVVAGFRWHKSGPVVGSLLLGLHDEGGRLQHVGVASSFPAKRRKELVAELEPYRADDFTGHPWEQWASQDGNNGDEAGDRMPGAPSRWNARKDRSWVPLRPELVCEVAYDHMEGRRFRHTAQFRRWRPDRDSTSCTYAQLEHPVAYDLARILTDAGG